MKESNEELANTKKSISSPQEETGGEIMVKVSLMEPNRDQPINDFNEEELQ